VAPVGMSKESRTVADHRSTAREPGGAPAGGSFDLLLNASAQLVGEVDDHQIGRVLVEQTAAVLHASDVRLALLEGDPGWWVLHQAIGHGATRLGDRQPSGGGLLGQVLADGQPLFAADFQTHPLVATEPGSDSLGSLVVVLLRFKGELLGALMAARRLGMTRFTDADAALIQVLADLAAARLGGSHEVSALRARAQELAVMHPALRPPPEQAGDLVIVANRERQIIDADDGACRILGYPREVLLQRGIGDMIPLPPWADKHDTLGNIREQLLRGASFTYDTTIRRRDSTLIPARMRLEMLPLPDGTMVTRAVLRDLSNEKQASLHALQAEKQRILQEVGAGLAHELNTPLAVVLGNVEMTLDEFQDPDLHTLLLPARDAAQRISAAVQSIQRFAKPILPGAWTSVDLSQLAAEVVEQTRPVWEEKPQTEGRLIHLRLEIFPVPALRGNPIELQEAIRELLANAVQAMPPGGTIVVRTEEAEGQVRLSVADNGVGMTEDVRLRCIEPFFTTRRPAASGLGLNRVYHTVLRHRGNLLIESTQGEGSCVTITLPLAATEAQDAPAGGASIGAPPEA
jgi:PAS domain S-box-containing protein